MQKRIAVVVLLVAVQALRVSAQQSVPSRSTPEQVNPGGEHRGAQTDVERRLAEERLARLRESRHVVKLSTKKTMAGTPRPKLDPAIQQALEQQSSQAHTEKNQPAVASSVGQPGKPAAGASSTPQPATAATGGRSMAVARPMAGASAIPAGQPARQPAPGQPAVATSRASYAAAPTQMVSNQPSSVPPGGSPSGGGVMGAAARVTMPMQSCMMNSSTPAIQTISGKKAGVIFTPDPGTGQYPNNQYTIKGCYFGSSQGQGDVHIYGGFINHNGPVKLSIDSWTDTLIVATFPLTFQDEYDLNNITLVVVASNGQSTQLPGNSFLAARASRPLTHIPKSVVTLSNMEPGDKDIFVSPVTSANLQAARAGLGSEYLQAAEQQNWAGYVAHEDSFWHDYPKARATWNDSIDFSRLRPGFVADNDLQTAPVYIVLSGMSDSCLFSESDVNGQLQGNTLQLTEPALECDSSGKFAYSYFGLMLSATGPKGDRLNPWPDGIQ